MHSEHSSRGDFWPTEAESQEGERQREENIRNRIIAEGGTPAMPVGPEGGRWDGEPPGPP